MKCSSWLGAALASLAVWAAPCTAPRAEAQSDWKYVPMNEPARSGAANKADSDARKTTGGDVVCRTQGAAGIGVRVAPATSKRLVIMMQGGGACVNKELCDNNPSSFSYDEFTSLRGTELNAGLFYRLATNNPFRDVHQVYIPYCSGDMHAGDAVRDIPSAGTQTFRGYANSALYFAEVLTRFKDVLNQSGAEVMLVGQSAGGFGAAFNLPRFRELLRAAAPAARLIFVSESAPLFEDTLGADCLTSTLRDLFQFHRTFLAPYTNLTNNWMVEWHNLILQNQRDVTQALFAAERDFVVKQLVSATFEGLQDVPRCAGLTDFTYDRLERSLRNARSRMQNASFLRGTPTATYFVTDPAFSWFHMFTTWPWYYAQSEPNTWGRSVTLDAWLPGLYGRTPGLGDHVGFP